LRSRWRRQAQRSRAKFEQLESFVRSKPTEHRDESIPILLGAGGRVLGWPSPARRSILPRTLRRPARGCCAGTVRQAN
jgi:hypothetical protein